MIKSLIHLALGMVLAPLLLSVINRTKALVAGRVGQPWLQPYFDLWKLLHKGAVYSETTTWIFRAGPLIALAAVMTAMLLLPFAGDAVFRFQGDLVVFVYFLGTARLATVLAALDTGSSFEGMGASREVWVSTLAEPALMLALAAVARAASLQEPLEVSLSFLHNEMTLAMWGTGGVVLALAVVALVVVLLAETSRIPIDDPTTHLELTMIHEVMVLDHGGVDLAFILYTAALKFWILAALLVSFLPVRTGLPVVDEAFALAGVLVVTVGVGVIESVLARVRLVRIPQLLIGASSIAALAFLLERQRGALTP